MKFSILLIAVGLTAMLFTGCAGYQLGGVKPGVYKDIEKLHVPTFKNLTLEPRLSSLVTNAVLAGLQSDGTYKVSNRADADAVLVGEIRQIVKQQLRAVRTDTLKSRELSLYLIVDFHLEDPQTGARIGDRVAQGAIEVPSEDKLGTAEEVNEREDPPPRRFASSGRNSRLSSPRKSVEVSPPKAPMKSSLLFLSLFLTATLGLAQDQVPKSLLIENARVAVIGDSITEQKVGQAVR